MTKDEIIANAKYLVFPYCELEEADTNPYKRDFSDFLKDKNYIRFNDSIFDVTYLKSEKNHHHIQTIYSYYYVMPVLNDLLNVGFTKDDFFAIENRQSDGDFSFLVPRKLKEYEVRYYEVDKWSKDGLEFHASYNYIGETSLSLAYSNIFNKDNNYGKLFKYIHKSCKINSIGDNHNGKTLIVFCDSHIAPLIPILCYYYKTVIVIDNGFDYLPILDKITEGETIDEALIQIWENRDLSRYLNTLSDNYSII